MDILLRAYRFFFRFGISFFVPTSDVNERAIRLLGQLRFEITDGGKLLPIGILYPAVHHILVALVVHLLKQEQPHHQPHVPMHLGRDRKD